MKNTGNLIRIVGISAAILGGLVGTVATSSAQQDGFTTEFRIEERDLETTGRNPYFILEPGYRATLSGDEDGDAIAVIISVLEETEVVDGVVTRVVEEREFKNDVITEISRNFFAICGETNDVFYFGEDVDNYDDEGNLEDHEGAWRAGVDGAMPGLIMPGTIALGSKYFQEVAPEIAMDRAEHVSITETVSTPAGIFGDCLRTEETTPLEPDEVSYKLYAPGVGMVGDDELTLSAIEGLGPVTIAPFEQVSNFTEHFMLDLCEFTTVGRNTFFILEPGYTLSFEGEEDEDILTLVITVLDDTEIVDGIETRVVEERETKNGILAEVSRNFFAICQRTNAVFYFGEDVDNYDDEGNFVDHESAWRTGVDGAKPGLMMSATPLLGSRYHQETAPEIAMDRGENVSLSETVETPAGTFENCLRVEESTPLEPDELEYKWYAPGIGLVRDSDLLLVESGGLSAVDSWELMR